MWLAPDIPTPDTERMYNIGDDGHAPLARRSEVFKNKG